MGLKNEEYRTQPTQRRGWVLIHASQSKANDDQLVTYGIDPKIVKRGAIIGAVKIAGCSGFPGDYAYHLVQPILFDKPVEGVKGKQAIFWGAKTESEQQAFTLAARQIKELLDKSITGQLNK